MGMVYAELTLRNAYDVGSASRGLIKEEEVRSAVVTALVDTGAKSMVISEELREELGLGIKHLTEVELANEKTEVARETELVEVQWKDRCYTGPAWVLSGWGEPLMGFLPLESMDLMVDPVHQELVGIHGDKELGIAVGVRVAKKKPSTNSND